MYYHIDFSGLYHFQLFHDYHIDQNPHCYLFTDDDISEASQETTQETVYDLTDIKVSVQAVSLCLNKEEYSLAKAKVSSLNCHLKLEGPNQDIAGSIGKFSLMDMSPNGKLYKEK